MKILHTADWHLGKRLDRFHRLEEQIQVMAEITEIADREQVDMVLIAGDLFDNFNPGTEATDLFYKTLKQLSANGKRPVIAIAGNHDSPSFINAPNPLARECGIILIGSPAAVVQPFELEHFRISRTDEGFLELELHHIEFPIRLLHTAYANETRLKEFLGEDKETELNRVLAERWKHLAETYCNTDGINLLMTHLYMNKKGETLLEEPDGEKPIRIGNADMIYSESIPEQIQYTALGHLHGHKNIGSAERPVVYASSPLCYSFSEAGQTKYVCLITAKPAQQATYERVALTTGKSLHRKTFTATEEALEWLGQNPECLVELTLESDTFLPAADRKRLYETHSGIVHLIPKVRHSATAETSAASIDLNQELLPLFKDFFKHKNGGQEPNEELVQLFNEIINS